LGAKLKKIILPNGVVAWGISSRKYVQSAVKNVQEYLAVLPGDQAAEEGIWPIFRGYKPDLDKSPELESSRENLLMMFI
jgi:hypothetical protein